MGRFRKFIQLPFRTKLLFSEALLIHLWAGLLLKIIPFRKIPGLFSARQPATGDPQSEQVYMVKDAIAGAGRISPWKNRCLVSSLAARCMLNRRKIPSALSLGMAKIQDGKTVAHAWIKAAEIEIVEKKGDYTELYSF